MKKVLSLIFFAAFITASSFANNQSFNEIRSQKFENNFLKPKVFHFSNWPTGIFSSNGQVQYIFFGTVTIYDDGHAVVSGYFTQSTIHLYTRQVFGEVSGNVVSNFSLDGTEDLVPLKNYLITLKNSCLN